MKTWNKPEIAELNISETANGKHDWYVEVEGSIFGIEISLNDSKYPCNNPS